MPSKKEIIEPKLTVNFQADSLYATHQPVSKAMGKSTPVIERELRRILPKINPEQRQSVAQQFLKYLGNKGIEKTTLQKKLSLATTDAEQMKLEEITKLATYAYQHYPDIFQTVLTQPNIVQFLSHPILSAIVGIMAAKWLNRSPS
ncbi:MAG: hypothetical protein BRC33_09630 [Cyanobacteria bacterium SW_9_44_58]|nr:MAG: hypothetical protein BRC33_09630 [Cyanobacteria bacterium SW_9_44_58]